MPEAMGHLGRSDGRDSAAKAEARPPGGRSAVGARVRSDEGGAAAGLFTAGLWGAAATPSAPSPEDRLEVVAAAPIAATVTGRARGDGRRRRTPGPSAGRCVPDGRADDGGRGGRAAGERARHGGAATAAGGAGGSGGSVFTPGTVLTTTRRSRVSCCAAKRCTPAASTAVYRARSRASCGNIAS